MIEIIESRKKEIENEIGEMVGEYFRTSYDYDESESIYFKNINKITDYVEWELKHNSSKWQERSERDKKNIIKLLSEWQLLDKIGK